MKLSNFKAALKSGEIKAMTMSKSYTTNIETGEITPTQNRLLYLSRSVSAVQTNAFALLTPKEGGGTVSSWMEFPPASLFNYYEEGGEKFVELAIEWQGVKDTLVYSLIF